MIKILKLAGMIIGALLLFLIMAFMALVTFVSPDRFKPVIVWQVKKYTGRELTIDGKLSWTFYPYLGLKAGHAALNNPSDFKQPVFAEFSNATMGVNLLPLFHGQIESRGITLHGMKLNLIRNAAGKTNWTFQSTSTTPQTTMEAHTTSGESVMPMGIVVSAIDVTNANVSWIDEQSKQAADIKNFSFHATKINLTQPFPITMDFDFSVKNPDTTGHIALNSQIAFSLNKQVYSLRDLDFQADIHQGPKKLNPKITGDVIADLSKQTLEWSHFKADIANLSVTGKMNVSQVTSSPLATGQLTLHPFDLKEFLKQTGQDNASLQVARSVNGNLDFTASSKTVTATGDVKVEQLQAAKLNMNNVDVKIHYLDGILSLMPMTAHLYDGSLDAQVKINLNTPQPQIALQGKLSNVQSEPLLKDLSDTSHKIKVKGAANIDFDLTTSGKDNDAITKNLNGTSHFSFNNGTLEGVDLGYMIDTASALASQKAPSASDSNQTNFGNLTATAVIHDGVVTNNDLLLKSPRFDTKGSGTINLIDKTINYSLQISVIQTQVSVVKELAGLTIPVRVTGSLDNPAVRLDSGALLKDVAEHQILQRKDEIQQKIKEKLPEQAGQLLQNLLGH